MTIFHQVLLDSVSFNDATIILGFDCYLTVVVVPSMLLNTLMKLIKQSFTLPESEYKVIGGILFGIAHLSVKEVFELLL